MRLDVSDIFKYRLCRIFVHHNIFVAEEAAHVLRYGSVVINDEHHRFCHCRVHVTTILFNLAVGNIGVSFGWYLHQSVIFGYMFVGAVCRSTDRYGKGKYYSTGGNVFYLYLSMVQAYEAFYIIQSKACTPAIPVG